jgi:hypothetical protein
MFLFVVPLVLLAGGRLLFRSYYYSAFLEE